MNRRHRWKGHHRRRSKHQLYEPCPSTTKHTNDRKREKYGTSRRRKEPGDGPKLQPYHTEGHIRLHPNYIRLFSDVLGGVRQHPNFRNYHAVCKIISAVDVRYQAARGIPFKLCKPLFDGLWYVELYENLLDKIKPWAVTGPTKEQVREIAWAVRLAHRASRASAAIISGASASYMPSLVREGEAKQDDNLATRGFEPMTQPPAFSKAVAPPRLEKPEDPKRGFTHEGLVNYVGLLNDYGKEHVFSYHVNRIPNTPEHAPLFVASVTARPKTTGMLLVYKPTEAVGLVASTKAEAKRLAAKALVDKGYFKKDVQRAYNQHERAVGAGRWQLKPSSTITLGGIVFPGSSLNGNNGEWTNGDDMPRQSNAPRFNMKGLKKVLINEAKRVAKDTGSAAAKAAVKSATQNIPRPLKAPAERVLNHLGRAIQRRFEGSGQYTVSDGIAHNPIITGKIDPTLSFGSLNGTRVRDRCFLGDVMTSGTPGQFQCVAYPIQPALALTFPTLATMSMNFEQYIFHGLIFEFITSSSNYNAGGALGTAIMSWSSNASAPAFTTKMVMENSADAISFALDQSGTYGIECKKGSTTRNSYYVRNNVTGGMQIADLNLGTFFMATAPSSTFAANSVVGELHVTYDIEFKNPRMNPARMGYVHYYRTGAINGGNLGSAPSGNQVAWGAGEGATVDPSLLTIPGTCPGDVWEITFVWTATVSGVYSPPNFTFTGWTTQAVYPSAAGGQNYSSTMTTYGIDSGAPSGSSSTTKMSISFTLIVTSANYLPSSIGVTAGTVAFGGTNNVDIKCQCIVNNITNL